MQSMVPMYRVRVQRKTDMKKTEYLVVPSTDLIDLALQREDCSMIIELAQRLDLALAQIERLKAAARVQ